MAYFKYIIMICITLMSISAPHAAPLLELPEPFPLSDSEISKVLLKSGQSISSSSLRYKLQTILFAVRCHKNFDEQFYNSLHASNKTSKKLKLLRKKGVFDSIEYKQALTNHHNAEKITNHFLDISGKWRNVYLMTIENMKPEYAGILTDEALGRIDDSVTGDWDGSLSAIKCSTNDDAIIHNVTKYFSDIRRKNEIVIRYGVNVSDEMEHDIRFLSTYEDVKVTGSDDLDNPDCVAILLNGIEMFRYTGQKIEKRNYHLRVARMLAEETPIMSRRYKSDCY
ncbi:hypothetical protein [Hoeflea sp.]|uniref:hypothetical protein n=1 Tax=Hoeflea sp. TaxID=1940281 RepID=UPI003A936112